MDLSDVSEIVEKYDKKKGGLISILEDIQAKYTYLPEEALRQVSVNTGRSLTDIYGVATFYKSFSLKPRGKHLISVCSGTACHVRGASSIAGSLEPSALHILHILHHLQVQHGNVDRTYLK